MVLITARLFKCFIKGIDEKYFECPLCGWRRYEEEYGPFQDDIERHFAEAHGLKRWLDLLATLAELHLKIRIDRSHLAEVASALRVQNRDDIVSNFLAAYLKVVHGVDASDVASSEKGMRLWKRKIYALMSRR